MLLFRKPGTGVAATPGEGLAEKILRGGAVSLHCVPIEGFEGSYFVTFLTDTDNSY